MGCVVQGDVVQGDVGHVLKFSSIIVCGSAGSATASPLPRRQTEYHPPRLRVNSAAQPFCCSSWLSARRRAISGMRHDAFTAGKRNRSGFRSGADTCSIRDLRATSSYPITAKSVIPISRSSRGSPRGLVNEGSVPRIHLLKRSPSHASSLDLSRDLPLCHDCFNCLELDRLPAVPSCEECGLMGETDSAWTGASLVIHS